MKFFVRFRRIELHCCATKTTIIAPEIFSPFWVWQPCWSTPVCPSLPLQYSSFPLYCSSRLCSRAWWSALWDYRRIISRLTLTTTWLGRFVPSGHWHCKRPTLEKNPWFSPILEIALFCPHLLVVPKARRSPLSTTSNSTPVSNNPAEGSNRLILKLKIYWKVNKDDRTSKIYRNCSRQSSFK